MTVRPKFPQTQRNELLGRLSDWFHSATGRLVTDAEAELVDSVLPNLFGYHIVQLGIHVDPGFVASSRISHAVIVDEQARSLEDASMVVGEWDALPLAADAVDVLVAPHVLEFAAEPHAVLREAQRVLIGEGYIVVTGFNPWSLCGCWRLLAGWRGRPPWCGRFVSASRLKDWLKLLGFEVEFARKASFRPPLRRAGITRRLHFLELLGKVVWPVFGNVYVIVARKHVAAATPLRASWKTRRRMIAAGVAEPTARVRKDADDEPSVTP
jgi:SAM-dependent methyltransferase